MIYLSFFWLSMLYFFTTGSYAVYPTYITSLYDIHKSGVVYGYFFTAGVPSQLISTMTFVMIKQKWGYIWMNISITIAQIIALIFVIFSKIECKKNK